jgi:hypothetical protein
VPVDRVAFRSRRSRAERRRLAAEAIFGTGCAVDVARPLGRWDPSPLRVVASIPAHVAPTTNYLVWVGGECVSRRFHAEFSTARFGQLPCRRKGLLYLPIIRIVNEPGTGVPWGPRPPPGGGGGAGPRS